MRLWWVKSLASCGLYQCMSKGPINRQKSKVGMNSSQGSRSPTQSTIPKHQSNNRYLGTKPKVTQWWISKSLLQDQGYYKSNTKIWLPKPNQPLKSNPKPLPLISIILEKQQNPTPIDTTPRVKTAILTTQKVSSKLTTSINLSQWSIKRQVCLLNWLLQSKVS